ncbi:hypothetical protein [Methanosphaera sp. WGK6]|uniref:hypothetical protein n=1 Tax=Methanosphaera sp. WGK6 TaxID=1561964 RepID=UPI00084C79F5|nr:hypothetical protein [Methanosphaera sp. WGK6]OED30405.1 hypothetical protein NL43_03310 [Methanosphaera sp. WGK6]
MTYQDKSVTEILNDENYPLREELIQEMDRIKKFTLSMVENITDEYISYQIRDMDFVKIYPEDDHIRVAIDMPYERVVDFASKCDVDAFNGRGGVDIVSYNITSKVDIQYGVSIAHQSYLYVKRLKI